MALATAIPLLAACTPPAPADIRLPPQNVDQWTNPLDQYVPTHLRANAYAEILLAANCMNGAGFAWAVPYRDTEERPGASWNSVARRLFSIELATAYGYHNAPTEEEPNPGWDAFSVRTLGVDEEATFVTCLEKVRKSELKLLDGATMNLAMGYLGAARDKAREHHEVKEAAGVWRGCMRPHGIADLPETPDGMPTDQMKTQFHLGSVVDETTTANPASAEEIEVAVADATCRESSGYRDALYQAEWDESVKLLAENFDALERALTAINNSDQAAQEVINANAPSN